MVSLIPEKSSLAFSLRGRNCSPREGQPSHCRSLGAVASAASPQEKARETQSWRVETETERLAIPQRDNMERKEGSGGRQVRPSADRQLMRERLAEEFANGRGLPALALPWLLPPSPQPCPLPSGSHDGERKVACLRPQSGWGCGIPEGRHGSPGPLPIPSGLLLLLLHRNICRETTRPAARRAGGKEGEEHSDHRRRVGVESGRRGV